MGSTLQVLCERRRYAKTREDPGGAVIEPAPQNAEFGVTNTRRVLEYGIEHRLKLAGRRTDYFKHFRGRRLLLQRLGKVARTRLHLIEQPRVLNRDHSLVGKSGDQLYLLVGKGVHFIAGEYEDTDRRSLAQEGYAKDGSVPKCLLVTGRLVFRIGQRVGNMNCLAFQGDPPRHAAAIQL